MTTPEPALFARGLLLPPNVVQPFFLLHRMDDLHVMAFFEGHPTYEAVEAMVQRRERDAWSIRAILTRHDQSQVDHINDPVLLARMSGARRETLFCPVTLELEEHADSRRARISFRSQAGEQVVLDVATVGLPDKRGGGLSDPGGHSADSSLPLMLRGASVLAGPRSTVTIDDVSFAVPVKVRTDAFIGHEGYYTEDHAMGVVRAGDVTLTVRAVPHQVNVGGRWLFEMDGREIAYAVTARSDEGELTIENEGDSGETITAFAVGDQLDVTRIHLPNERRATGGLTLSFDRVGGFSLSMDGAEDLVSGCTVTAGSGDDAMLSLCATQPDWAVSRRVDVRCVTSNDELRFVTTIGGAGST